MDPLLEHLDDLASIVLDSFDHLFLLGAVDELDDVELLDLVDQEGRSSRLDIRFFESLEPLDDGFEALDVDVYFEALVFDAEERIFERVLHLTLLQDSCLVVFCGVVFRRLVRAGWL